MKNIDGEIIVIDNASTDGSFDFFQHRFPEVNFFWNKSNVGFAKANNHALKMAKGQYILFLNPDTIIPEDCFEKCISFLKLKNDGAALGIKMLDGSGRFLKESKRAFPSPITSFYKLAGLSKLFPHSSTFAKYHLGNLNENQNHEVDVLAGAFMLIPKEILDKTGGFDAQFFMYGEDIDLSYRIQKAGYKNFYFAESPIIHFKGESTKKGSLNYVMMFYRAMGIFVKKHYGSNKSGVYHFLLQTAIFSRASLSAVRRVTKKFTGGKKSDRFMNNPVKIVVAASETEYADVKELLKRVPEMIIKGRIETDTVFSKNTIGSFRDLANVFSFSNADEIIFCEGQLSFKQIISAMHKVPDKIAIKIFSSGSHAIIGSDNKNLSGTVMVKEIG